LYAVLEMVPSATAPRKPLLGVPWPAASLRFGYLWRDLTALVGSAMSSRSASGRSLATYKVE
jgi:hypothetical protein